MSSPSDTDAGFSSSQSQKSDFDSDCRTSPDKGTPEKPSTIKANQSNISSASGDEKPSAIESDGSSDDSSEEGEDTRDWSHFDLLDGPAIIDEDDPLPIEDDLISFPTFGPHPIDVTLNAKKEKEAKKNAEKEAKMKKFLEKKEAAAKKQLTAEPKKPKEKVEKEKVVKGPTTEELLKNFETLPKGSKKPVDGKLLDAYDPKYVEALWYDWWVKEGYFKPEYNLGNDTVETAIEKRGKFVIVIPPPNVTGTLHLGHALTCSFEDALTRWNRMAGKVTLWVPGCDHAGIATQMVVEKSLARNEGISRHDLGREEFVNRVWQWKEQKGARIYDQLQKMGISADWDRESFTMGPKLSKAVMRCFVTLFDKGLIYRSDRLVNWSCTLKSCISDIEVDKVELTGKTLLFVPGYEEKVEFGVLTSFAYKIDDDTEIVVATTRPETMLGDVAIAVHPEDERYTHLIGKKAKHPFVDRELPVIADEFVDKEFGTGCVKITPAHDPNDYDVGKRHNLEFITIIDEEGKMINNCGKFSGMKRFHARKAVVEALTELGLFRESKDNPMVVPTCSRSKDIVEPLLKMQWYVSCTNMAKAAIEIVQNQNMRIIPDLHIKTWNFWMEGIRDWCISRQLWWGHQIPAYRITGDTVPNDEEIWVAAETEEEAKFKAKEKFPKSNNLVIIRDEDVLDTWFSSALFPFSVFGWPNVENPDFKHFYPNDLLETGHDILFFWVAKMVFMGQTLTANIPFRDVFLHSLVRDAHGRKMSKSLGNVIDPLDVIRGITLAELHKSLEEGNLDPKEIEKAKQGQKQDYPNGIPECGTDALRFALCACMTPGRDINLDVLRVQGYRFFCNKIWNAVKFSMNYLSLEGYTPSDKDPVNSGKPVSSFDRMDRWILSKLSTTVRIANDGFVNYSFQEITSTIYNFWLYDLCDVYLESLKPKFESKNNLNPEQITHLDVLLLCIEVGLRLLSPFMPYLTEELWQRLPIFLSDQISRPPSICVAKYPITENFKDFENSEVILEVDLMNHLIHTIRSTRSAYNLPNKVKTEIFVLNTDKMLETVLEEDKVTICALSYTQSLKLIDSKDEAPLGSAAAVVTDKCTVYLGLKGLIDPSKEEERIQKKITTAEQQLAKLKEATSKPDYESKVPKEIQETNSSKMSSLDGEIQQLSEALAAIKIMLKE